MADEGVRIEGLNTLIRTLDKASEEITALKDAHKKAGEIVASEAETIAPRISGRLVGTIKAARQARRARVQSGRASVPYAGPIHWGWPRRGIEPQPFLSDAAKNTEPRWTAQYREDVQKALDEVKGA